MQLYDYAPELTENVVDISDEVNILKTSFGDRYGVTAPDGLNHIRQKVSVIWNGIYRDKKDILMAFFRERGGYKNFAWTPPSEPEEKLWKCETYKSIPMAPNYFTVSADMYEDFSLGEDY